MAAILDAILKIIAFPMWDFGGLLVCYLWYQILPKSVEKPFVAICWGLNCRLTRLYSFTLVFISFSLYKPMGITQHKTNYPCHSLLAKNNLLAYLLQTQHKDKHSC